MRYALWLLLLFTVAVVAAVMLGNNDGVVVIAWRGWRVDVSLNLFLAGLDVGTAAEQILNGMMGSFLLLAIPLFILAAAIMNTSGISHRLIDFCQALVGWMRGALAQVNVLSHMFFAEISGSAVAGVAATASIIMPAMKARGYPGPFTAAVTSSTVMVMPAGLRSSKSSPSFFSKLSAVRV